LLRPGDQLRHGWTLSEAPFLNAAPRRNLGREPLGPSVGVALEKVGHPVGAGLEGPPALVREPNRRHS
jgi:hypothetical protein